MAFIGVRQADPGDIVLATQRQRLQPVTDRSGGGQQPLTSRRWSAVRSGGRMASALDPHP